MDPLSLTASVIAVAHSVLSTAKAVEKLISLKKLPVEFGLLLSEVEVLEDVLQECVALLAAANKRREQIGDDEVHARTMYLLDHHLTRAKTKLDDLSQIISCHASPRKQALKEEVKIFWKGFVVGRAQVLEFRDELIAIRLTVATLLGISTSSAVLRLENVIEGVAKQQGQLLQAVRTALRASRMDWQQWAMPCDGAGDPRIDEAQPLPRLQSDSNASKLIRPLNTREWRPKPISWKKIDSLAEASGASCVPWCSCRCHKVQSYNMPKFLHRLLGNGAITCSGIPAFTATCDQTACHRRLDPTLIFTYRLPMELIQYFLQISVSFSGFYGPELRVKLPRKTMWTNQIWGFARERDVESIRKAFDRGEASPWDVNPIGGSLLHYVSTCSDHFNAELCRLILDAGVEPSVPDEHGGVPAMTAWERVLSLSLSNEDRYAATSLFADTDYLMSLQLTVLHKIVLNLIPKDLKGELEHDTANINVVDTRGRTCLAWASLRGEAWKVKVLLEHGAKVDIRDKNGDSPLHHTKCPECVKLLVDAGIHVDTRNHFGATPLMLACRANQTPDVVSALLQKGADVNAVDKFNQAALHGACDHGRYARCVEILLRNAADINVPNSTDDSPLRLAVLFNTHGGLRYMLHTEGLKPDFESRNCFGHTFAHTIAHYADLETVNILTEAAPWNLLPDTTTRDAGGLTSIEHFEGRSDVDGNLRAAFQRLFETLKARQANLYQALDEVVVEETDEIFYDAVSAV